jgi:hypothetical protein
MKDDEANYLWADVEGTGSLSLSFEKILEKPKLPNTDCNRFFKNPSRTLIRVKSRGTVLSSQNWYTIPSLK